MSAAKRIRIAGLAVLCLAVLASAGCRAKEKKDVRAGEPAPAAQAEAAAKAGLDLGLSISPGSPAEESLFVLRLFSASLRQEELDNAAKKEGQKTRIDPVRISIPRPAWESVVFRIVGESDSAGPQAALSGAVLVDVPASEGVAIGPKDTLTAVYRIPTANLPPPGTLVRAEMKTGAVKIRSEAVPIPKPPDTKLGLLLRKAEIGIKMKSWPEAQSAAEDIIKNHPGEAAGYWLKAQALEGQGALTEALKLYAAALEKALAQKSADHYEPPLPILIKIRDLEEKLAVPSKK